MTRVGLAGFGFAGRDIHVPRLLEAGLDVVAVSTRDAGRAAAARTDLPGVEVVADLDALLAVPDLDVVVLATPSGGHAQQVRVVVDAGVACVVDKPLAVDAASAADTVRYAARAGVPLTVFQNRRYDPSAVTLRGVLAAGLVGEPFRFEMRWERWRPVPKDRWRENAPPEEGGGLLLDLHTHLVDAAVTMFGRVERVAATLASRTTVAEDDAFVLATHTSGVVSHLSATSLAAAPGPRVRLLGREGAYVLADFEGEEHPWSGQADLDADHCGWVYRGAGPEAVPRALDVSQGDFYRAVDRALAAPRPQVAMPVDPWDAVHTLAVLDAARVAAREERVVTVVDPPR
ncbi:Gfo/Idh/MocA family oxidoreductase [Arthrobacter sp. NEB 688]|uniref:Gfo/Idh/MocA family protein n=1 Tax=Arthrobacter sp. NEB 688 TaxID=904039 RepID=UPI0015662690|nr:Gfo/Idh/MocA family oxidoreductase [Arthrobacter sp. NEB 688]QKE84511.1 Gfo/Idh/MocA family oxidoreductase [Arthrobacter sp. NEB 688]